MVEDLCFKHFSFFWMNFGENYNPLSLGERNKPCYHLK